MRDVVTVSRGVEVGGPLELVVSRTGRATVAWTAAPGGFGLAQIIGVADVPRAPGDPQIPLGPPDAQDPLDAQVDAAIGSGFEAPGSHMGIDGADVQTLLWQQDLLTPPGPEQDLTEYYDVAVAERAPGAGWSTAPSLGLGYVGDAQLAVNASGAAVVAWDQFIGKRFLVFASYRNTAGAAWTAPQRVPRVDGLMQVGIDDAGRVLLVYEPYSPRKRDPKAGVLSIRRTPAGRWGKPNRIVRANTYLAQLAVAAGGAAVVAYGVYYGTDRKAEQFLSRMSPAGTWSAPVRHPSSPAIGQRSFDIDAKGRALITWWDGTDLLGRWSRPAGRRSRPCVLAADVSKPRRAEDDTRVVMNRRGDALVVWRATGRVGELWARYKPVGDGWTRPFKVTPGTSPPRASFTAAIGDRGHVAVAWTTRNNRQLQVRRVSLAP